MALEAGVDMVMVPDVCITLIPKTINSNNKKRNMNSQRRCIRWLWLMLLLLVWLALPFRG